jgi:hypothetical protein
MLHVEFRQSFADAVIEPRKPSAAERFQRVLALLRFEYDLDPDVLAEARHLLRRLRARNMN